MLLSVKISILSQDSLSRYFIKFFLMNRIKKLILQYSGILKYGLLFINFFLMIFAIGIYINYATIIENTDAFGAQQKNVENQIIYTENFQLKYLDSEHAKYFLYHENTLLFPGERIINFEKAAPKPREKDIPVEERLKLSPKEAWKRYFNEKKTSNISKK